MIVVDASAMIEVLLQTPAAASIEQRILEPDETLHVPHLLDLEVAQTLRRFVAAGQAAWGRCQAALEDLAAFSLRRHPHNVLLPRVWALRTNLTAYDAVYVALAEALNAPLLTRDKRLAAAPGHSARIELV